MYAQEHTTIRITPAQQELLSRLAERLRDREFLSELLTTHDPDDSGPASILDIAKALSGAADGKSVTFQPPSKYVAVADIRAGFGITQETMRRWCARLGITMYRANIGVESYLARDDYDKLRQWRFAREHPNLP
ncbi:hypothetical protein ACNI3K_00450 [Demequina sp. SO4-13]|uniref:hypothetical protein n=1 Tax=Demequina sp. SO4-13 TaxID=3401027 RepID=UPI003AF66C1A